MDKDEFVRLLQGILTPNTEGLKDATAKLKKDYYIHPEALTVLLKLQTSHELKEMRQLAAVEARNLVPKHWSKVPASQKPHIREALLQAILAEQDTLVRHSSARVISAIAKIDLLDAEWLDLPDFLQRISLSDNALHREVGVYILFTLLETIEDGLEQKFDQLFSVFAKTIKDPESIAVRVNTTLALAKIASIIDAEENEKVLAMFREIFPQMVLVLKDVVQTTDEEKIMQSFEVFQSLLTCDPQYMSSHFKDLIQFMIDLAAAPELPDDSRSQAIGFLMQCVKYRKLKIQALKFGEQMTLKMLQIVTELKDLHDEDDEMSAPRSALGLLDMMASCLPPSQVVVPLMHNLGPYVNSEDPNYRRAGILSLGMCVEGAPDFISTQLGEILPLVIRLLNDQDVRVRQAALHGVARLADDLAEECGKEHDKLIPALLKNLTSATAEGSNMSPENVDIVKAACSALDSLFIGLEEEQAAHYLADVMGPITQFFSHPDLKVKASAIGAVGAIAGAAEKAFLPYFDPTMHALSSYITLKDSEDELDLRSTAMGTIGFCADAVGAEKFQPYVQPLMASTEEALQLENPRLKETCYIFWSTMAKVYEEEFAPFLQGVVKGLFASLEQDEADLEIVLGEEAAGLLGKDVIVGGKKIKVKTDNAAASDPDVLDDDSDDEDEDFEDIEDIDAEWDDFEAVTAIAQEKEIAMEVLGDVLTHTKDKFLPFFEKTIEIVLGLIEHSYEGVRKSAISTLWRAYANLWTMCENNGSMPKWQPGIPIKVQPTAELIKLGEVATKATLDMYAEEDDPSVVADISRNLAATLKLCGPAFLQNPESIHKLCSTVLAIVTKGHPCQQDMGGEDMEDLDEISEYDWQVVDTALDVVIWLAGALGDSFGELWKMFEKPIIKYAGSSDSNERSTAVGTLAEVIAKMGSSVTPYTSSLLKLLIHRLSDEDLETKSNAAFAVGNLCLVSEKSDIVLKNYNTILQKLEPLLQVQSHRLLDNAAGCVARMIIAHPDNVPLDEVLPALIGILPLKEDMEENEPIYECIVKLYQTGNSTVRNLTPQIVPLLAHVLGPPEDQLPAETKSKVIELVKYLAEKQPGLLKEHPSLKSVV